MAKAPRSKAPLMSIAELEKLAEVVFLYRRRKLNRRPIVVEFAGSPKSGKTSCIQALDLFLRRNEYKTKIIGEKAHISPISNKKDPSYNIWTFTSMIADLAEALGNQNKEHDLDIVLLDRGFFDAYCWFAWLNKNRHLDNENFEALKNFIFMPRWLDYLDLVLAFTTPHETSLKREHAILLTNKQGSIMNNRVLDSFNKTINDCYTAEKDRFKSIELISTDEIDLPELNLNITMKTLSALIKNSSEEIGYINNSVITKPSKPIFPFKDLGVLDKKIDFNERKEVESDINKIQLVPIVVITNKSRNKIFVVKKIKTKDKASSPEFEKILPYLGGHLRKEDRPLAAGRSAFDILNRGLQREIKEEIGVDYIPSLDGRSMAIWIQDKPRSQQHIAICAIWEVDFEDFNYRLTKDEFSSAGKKDSIVDVATIVKNPAAFEDWGLHIFEQFFKIKIPVTQPMVNLFEDIK